MTYLLIATILAPILLAGILYLEARLERRKTEPKPAPEYVDPWASLPPRWNPPEGERWGPGDQRDFTRAYELIREGKLPEDCYDRAKLDPYANAWGLDRP